MKQGSFRAVHHIVFLLVLLGLVFPAFGDEVTADYQAIVLESFDGNSAHQWEFGDRSFSYDYEWALDASKFATVSGSDIFPKLTYVEAWPMALFGLNRNQQELKSLGVWGRFDRRGYNWVDVYPVRPGTGGNGEAPEAFEIPLPGRITNLDMWVWGANLNFYLEAYVRDHNGVVHALNMGGLGYQGWRNLRVQIPNSIRQSKRILPRLAGLTFVKFRIWTTPLERVDNFYVYFDQMKVLTDTFESLYDGDDLADPERVQELWAQNQGGQE